MAEGVTQRFVLDGSLTLAWYFADEADPYADAVAHALTARGAVVPCRLTTVIPSDCAGLRKSALA
jgi:hypothetical protein